MTRRVSPPQRHWFRPRLEGLEDRTALSTLTVLNVLDKGAGSLRDTITSAKSGDTIVFAPNLERQTITLTSDQLTINKSLDIEGPGASLLAISGNDANRVFSINEGFTVAIAGLTITHGRAQGANGGGGILNAGSTLTVANDVFSSNEHFGGTFTGGGAISNVKGANLAVIGSAFVGNQAIGGDGGDNALGGGIVNSSSTATVTRCTFTGNVAVGGDGGKVSGSGFIIGGGTGGGIKNTGNGATLTVMNSSFFGNEAIGGNGGNGAKGASLYLVDFASGGGIGGSDHTALFVSGCTFVSNRAIGGSNAMGGASGEGFVGTGSGGGLTSDATTTIANTMFDDNEARGGSGNSGGSGFILLGVGRGGGINNVVTFHPVVTLSVSNCTFTNNRAIGGNGNTGGPFANDGTGGGLSNSLGATATLNGCLLTGDQAKGGAGGSGFGGGVYNDGQSSLTVLFSTITANQAAGGAAGAGGSAGEGIGGGAYFGSGGIVCLDVFTSLNIVGNTASTSNNDKFGLFTICSS
jgi:hypothetical protein